MEEAISDRRDEYFPVVSCIEATFSSRCFLKSPGRICVTNTTLAFPSSIRSKMEQSSLLLKPKLGSSFQYTTIVDAFLKLSRI